MSKSDVKSEFFVGYLPTPERLRRFLLGGLLALGLIAGVLGLLLAAGERDPGPGAWDLDKATALDGVVYAAPCPLIRVLAPDGTAVSVLLVDQGKQGALKRIRSFDGAAVHISGHSITRSGVRVLEMDEGSEAIKAMGSPAGALRVQETTGWREVMLRGEIVDPKCFAGAMKPGEGKTHKACAALCIKGGIPPMFLSNSGEEYLVVDSAGVSLRGEALEKLLPLVGDFVEIRGRVGTWGDLRLVEISAIRRI